jgi:hypothetical protein
VEARRGQGQDRRNINPLSVPGGQRGLRQWGGRGGRKRGEGLGQEGERGEGGRRGGGGQRGGAEGGKEAAG